MNDLFLGLDCSTQSLTYVLIDFSSKKIKQRDSVNFDKDLPHYNTKNGIIKSNDNKVIHSDPLMWVEALEILLRDMKKKEIQIQKIKAISGSGQQHGTVYLNDKFEKKLQNLSLNEFVVDQIDDCFTRKSSPIWMDSSTSKQCDEIRRTLGGMKETIKITGSNTFERFSGPQIRKLYQEHPEVYKKTSIIHLVSSFLASILLGKNAPIDYGDGSGMNLMNIETKKTLVVMFFGAIVMTMIMIGQTGWSLVAFVLWTIICLVVEFMWFEKDKELQTKLNRYNTDKEKGAKRC